MKILIGSAWTIVCLASAALFAQPTSLPLEQGWVFKTGDDASWSQLELDDAGWQAIQVGDDWESQGIEDYNGYAWYRLHLSIPTEVALPQGAMRLQLGAIDDVDETWFNGERIGGTGSFPPQYGPSWNTRRTYLIPKRLIRPGADNVLAVRVYDGDGRGGMVSGPYELVPATLGDLLSVEFDLGRGDGIFADEDRLPIRVRVVNRANEACEGRIKWTVEDDEGAVQFRSESPVKLAVGSTESLACSESPAAAGFYRIRCELVDEANQTIKETTMMLGLRPEEIQSKLTAASDLGKFWKGTLAQLADVPPEFELVAQPQLDSATHTVFEVRMRSLGNVRVGGWYQQPKRSGPRAAVLRVPGYSENMRPIEIDDPVAVFSFNVRGHGNSQQDVSSQPEDYWIRGLDDKQGYFYQGAYADCIRAVDFLESRDEVDQHCLAVTGGSQGGGFSLVTAALDPRIDFCAPDIPFLCDWVKYFKTTDWPEMNNWVAAEQRRTWKSTLHTMSYFDALNLADRIRCPVFLGMGLQDDVCPPATIYSVYNRLDGPKEVYVYPEAGHWVDAVHEERRWSWLREQFEQRTSARSSRR